MDEHPLLRSAGTRCRPPEGGDVARSASSEGPDVIPPYLVMTMMIVLWTVGADHEAR